MFVRYIDIDLWRHKALRCEHVGRTIPHMMAWTMAQIVTGRCRARENQKSRQNPLP